MAVPTGPTANLPGWRRITGSSGTVWRDARQLGEVSAIEATVAVAQIEVPIPGTYRTENKPGVETRSGNFTVQKMDSRWQLEIWRFLEARRAGDHSAAAFPEFSLTIKLDDIGAFDVEKWQLDGVQLFTYDLGFSIADELINRTVPFSYRADRPIHGFEITDGDPAITENV